MDHLLREIEKGVGGISKGFVGKLVWEMKKMAAPLLQPFGPNSNPTFICEEDLKPLKAKLDRIRATLKDSETLLSAMVKDESWKLWLSELRELEYSAEDILEEFEFECIKTTKLEEFRSQLRRNAKLAGKRKRDDVSILFSSPCGTSLRRKITKLGELYHEIAFDRMALSLREVDGERRQPYCSRRPPSSSLIVGDFHGRSSEMKKVISLLFSDENQKCPFSVIPIIGMGGVGKTTLVKHVYNDEKVLSHFDVRMWICMSEGLDVVKVTRAIWEALRMESTSCPSELDLAQKDVISVLSGKRVLLVLDDVWIAEQWRCHWEGILAPLEVAAKGSKVLLTSTDAGLAKFAGAVPYPLSYLSDSDCWLICQHYAFGNRNPASYPDLIQIGKLINQKCKGLPLASMVLGCLLRTDLDEKHWRRVLESDLSSHEEFENDILPVLRLSYDHLPMHLKLCFMYCSLFPKDYTFEKENLVSLWIAQGFVKRIGRLGLEDTGSKYFDELVERSFFQPSPVNDQSQQRYVMHDLFHDLAESLAGFECKRTENHKLCELHHKTRHSSIVPHEIHLEKSIQFELNDGQDLRSLLLIRRNERIKTPFCIEIPIFSLLQCLRALDLSNTDIVELPVSIGNLIHLRYFGLKNTKIRRLPESICGLFKLHTLDLKQCYDLEQLPLGLNLLSNLQNLELPSHIPNVHLPSGNVDSTDFQTTSVSIEKNEPEFCEIQDSRHMANLRGDPRISEIKDVVG